MRFISRFCPCFTEGSQIWVTVTFGFRTELGSILHHVLKAGKFNKKFVGHQHDVFEEVMDYRTYCFVIAALVQKPSRDFPLKQGREQSPEIDIISSW